MWCCLCDPTFSHFSRTPTCDRRMDRECRSCGYDVAVWVHSCDKITHANHVHQLFFYMHMCVVHMLCSQVYGPPLLGQPQIIIIKGSGKVVPQVRLCIGYVETVHYNEASTTTACVKQASEVKCLLTLLANKCTVSMRNNALADQSNILWKCIFNTMKQLARNN